MTITEKLIDFQNQAERNFEENKTLKNSLLFGLALILFMASTLFATATLPIRLIIKLFKTNRATTHAKTEKNLLYFTAEWCGPCVMMKPTLSEFENSHPEISIEKVYIDLNQGKAKEFGIKGVPQMILVNDGTEIKRNVGTMTLSDMERFVA